MKTRASLIFLLFFFLFYESSAQDFRIAQVKLEFVNNQLHIIYNIDSKNPADKFSVTVVINRQNGEAIQPKSISGDIGDNIKSGNYKRIIWDLGKDAIYLDEDITVEVLGDLKSKTYNKGSLILSSALLPGLGQSKITGKPWYLGGVATYGALAGGMIFHKMSLDTYEKYDLERENPETRDKLYNQSVKEWTFSTGLFATAAVLWTANMIWIIAAPERNYSGKQVSMYLKPAIFPGNPGTMVSLRVNF